MSRPPSESRIAIWERRATMLDTHFGYHHLSHPEEGPCSMTLDYLAEAYRQGQITIMHIETFFEAVEAVKKGTRTNDFLPNRENRRLDHEFDLYHADFDKEMASLRFYITDELREQYLELAFSTSMYSLDQPTIKRCHQALAAMVKRENQDTPSWAAMSLALRVYEWMLIHLSNNHSPTRKCVESCFKDDIKGQKRALYCRRAREEARAFIRCWQKAFGIETMATSLSQAKQPSKPKPMFTVIRGGKT